MQGHHLPISHYWLKHTAILQPSSATTLISIWNTWVFRTALTALTEPCTLWRRNTRSLTPRRRVTLHTYLLYFVVTYTHHQNNTCVTLFAGAAVMLKPFFRRVLDHRRAFLPAFRVTWSAGDKPGSTWQCRQHVWEHLESQSCIQFVFSSMYLCIYIATHLHTLYLDWLQAVLESNSRCAWKWRASELRDILRGRDRASLEMHLEAVIERDWRCTWRPCSCELASHNRASLKTHLEAVIERVWRCTWRPWSREIGPVLGSGRWTAPRVMRLYSSVSYLATVGMWQCDFIFELSWRAGWWRSIV